MRSAFNVREALAAARAADDGVYAVLFARGTLEIGYYAPLGADTQSPHGRDEIYFVQAGRGYFESGGVSRECAAGDALFVPAGVAHRFHDFSDGFAAWVVFCGPEGGAAP